MTGLTHEQARRCLQAGADKCLNPLLQAALDAHLADCTACRKYAEELAWLQLAIVRALRSRWSSPQRPTPSPVEMVARVRHRIWFDAERRLLLTFAQAVVRLGSLAVVVIMVVGLVQGSFLQADRSSSVTGGNSGSGLINGLPSFELEADSDVLAAYVSSSSNTERWLLPAFPFSRLRVSRY